MPWRIHIEGESADLSVFSRYAPAWDVEIVAENGGSFLTSSRFDHLKDASQARESAREIIQQIRGKAQLDEGQRLRVALGAGMKNVESDGNSSVTIFAQPLVLTIKGYPATLKVTRADGTIQTSDDVERRKNSIVANNRQLAEVISVLADELSWQKLRVSLELFSKLIGGDAKNLQPIWRKGYSPRQKLEEFKANIEDPRHSGFDAVHGLPRGPLRGSKLTLDDGRRFMSALVEKFIEENVDAP